MTKKLFFLISFGLLLSWALPVMAIDTGFTPRGIDPCDPNIVVYCRLNQTGDPNSTPRVTNDANIVGTQPPAYVARGLASGKDGHLIEVTPALPAVGVRWPSTGDPNIAWDAEGVISGGKSLKLTPGNGNTVDAKGGGRVHVPVTWSGGTQVMHPDRGTVAIWAKQAASAPGADTDFRYLVGFANVTGSPYGSRVQIYFVTDAESPGKENDICVGMGLYNKNDKWIRNIPVNNWNHYALTWQTTNTAAGAGTYTLYVDGYDQGPGTGIVGQPTPGTYIGLTAMPDFADIGNDGRTVQNLCFYGKLDEAAFYNKVLTRDKICELAGHDPNYAWNPGPEDKTIGQSQTPTLTWTKGKNANRHVVYFGTDYLNPPAVATFTDANTSVSYTPGQLLANKKYGWKLREMKGTTIILATAPFIWTFTTIGNTSYDPIPVSGVANVNSDVTLTWTKSANATSHNVYLGTSFADVNDATNPAVPPAVANGITTQSYVAGNPPTNMKLGKKYYWRVDDRISSTVYKGDIWNYTISDYFVVDNFEYGIGSPVGLTTVWKATGDTGAFYQYYKDYDTVYFGGEGTLQNIQNLRGAAKFNGHTRTYTSAWDYTFGGGATTTDSNDGMKAMTVWYKCDPNTNVYYVQLRDSSSRYRKSTLASPVKDWEWNLWKIDLAQFSGCDLNSVNYVEVGVGDGTNTYGAATNNKRRWTDIRLYQKTWYKDQDADIDGDHKVDLKDYAAMAGEWKKPAVNLVQNPEFKLDPNGQDPNGAPLNWIARVCVSATSQPYVKPDVNGVPGNPEAPYIIDVLEEEGNPKKPCGRIMLTTAMTALWSDGGLAQSINVSAYSGQTLNISWMCKGDISVTSDSTGGENPVAVNRFYEPRFEQRDHSALASTGAVGTAFFREEQRGKGANVWDWKLYTYSISITKPYLHMFHDLSGRKDPAPFNQLLIDHMVVKTADSIIPISDLSEDNEIDFDDLYILAGNWLDEVVKEPPWVY